MSKRNHIDFPVLIAVLVLMVLSLGVVYSASATMALRRYGESAHFLNSHVLKTLLALALLFLGIMIAYRKYRKLTKLAIFAAVALLLATLGLGSVLFIKSRSPFGRSTSEKVYCSDPMVNTAVFWIRFIDLNLTPIPSGVTLITSPAIQTTLPKSAWAKAT